MTTTPIAAVKSGFRHYFQFSGRATRPQFWWWILFLAIAGTVLGIVDRIIGWDGFNPLPNLFTLATLLPTLAVTSRRLHDIGKTGWWQLVWQIVFGVPWAVAFTMFIIILLAFGKSWDWTIADPANFAEIIADLLPAVLAFIVAAAVSLCLAIWIIIWLARPGDPGPNRYGPDPQAPADHPPAYPGPNDWYTEPPR